VSVRFRCDRHTIKVKINTQVYILGENISNPRFENRRKSRVTVVEESTVGLILKQ
jgi:hypothetical protein